MWDRKSENFFKLIEQNNLKIEEVNISRSYIFSEAGTKYCEEAKENKYQIIMTEKIILSKKLQIGKCKLP